MPRWTTESRQRQAELCRQNQPWEKASGPATEYGKKVSSRNAVKKKRPCKNVTPVSLMSLQPNEGDTDRRLGIGDRAEYTGSDPAIALISQGKPMEIFRVQEGMALCWVGGFPGLLTVPLNNLLQQS